MAVSHAAPAAPPTAPSPLDDRGLGLTHKQILVVMSGLMLGMLLAALDQTIVTTALQTIAQDFGRQDLYSWVLTSYLLTSTASTPLYGKLSDLYGRKLIFQASIVIFLFGSVLCGASQSMLQLVIFRGVQGLGAGGLISLALAIIGDIIPPRDRGKYQGYFGAVFGSASVIGPVLGGTLTQSVDWRWVFYVNIPLGIVALVVINRVLHLPVVRRKVSIDWTGAALLVVGVSLLLIAVQDSGRAARISGGNGLLMAAGAAVLVGFVLWERKAVEPVLPLRLFRGSVFRVTSGLSFVTGAVMFGVIIFLPQYMQIVRGASPTAAGLRLLPLMAGLLLTSITSGRIISRVGRYKAFVVAGTAIAAFGMFLLSRIQVDTSAVTLAGYMFVMGFGLGLFMQTTVLAIQNAVDRTDLGVATSTATFFRTLGGAIGAAVLGAILLAQQRHELIARLGPGAAGTPAAGNGVRGGLDGLPAAVQTAVRQAFTDSMTHAYRVALPVAALAFVLALLLRDLRLRGAAAPAAGGAGNPGVELRGTPGAELRGTPGAELPGTPGAALEEAAGAALEEAAGAALEEAAGARTASTEPALPPQ